MAMLITLFSVSLKDQSSSFSQSQEMCCSMRYGPGSWRAPAIGEIRTSRNDSSPILLALFSLKILSQFALTGLPPHSLHLEVSECPKTLQDVLLFKEWTFKILNEHLFSIYFVENSIFAYFVTWAILDAV